MPPVWGQSASCRRSYACFTEEWSVCLSRGSCRGNEGLSVDGAPLPSIDCDDRTWTKHISRPTEAQKPHKVTKIPMEDQKPYLCISKPLLMATLSLLHYSCFGVGEKINSPSEIDWNSIGFIFAFLSIILFRL